MDIREFFTNVLTEQGKLFKPRFFPDEASEIQVFELEETYLQIRLLQMFLKQTRELYKTRYPIVHALFRFSGLEGQVEVNQLVTPLAPGQTRSERLNRVISLNQNLLGPILYRGGSVELLIGLYSAPASDWAERFLNLAQEVSALAMQAQLTTAISIAKPIKASVEGLLGANDIDLKLGLNIDLRPNKWLQPGYLAIIDAPANEIQTIELFVDDGALYTRRGPYDEHDLLLLAVEAYSQRGDWQQLGLGGLWKRLIEIAAMSDSKDAVTERYIQFSGAVMGSEDLSWADRQAICQLAQRRVVGIRKSRTIDFLAGVKAGDADVLEPLMEVSSSDLMRTIPRTKRSVQEMVSVDWL